MKYHVLKLLWVKLLKEYYFKNAKISKKCYGCFYFIVLQGLIQELVGYNMRRGSAVIRTEVRQLLFLLTRDNAPATELLNDILMARIGTALQGHRSNPDLVGCSLMLASRFFFLILFPHILSILCEY